MRPLQLALGACALAAGMAHAAGPLSTCSNAALKYTTGSVSLHFDGGGTLGTTRSKSQADSIVAAAIALWTNVPTSSLVMSRGPDLPVDVTAANVGNYIGNTRDTDGINPVIYDTDGSIVDALLGVGARNGVLGFAGSASYGPPTCRYAEGQAVINGAIAVSSSVLTVVIAHELGHLVGLDHAQLDATQGLTSASYPLMYPIAHRTSATLHEDDVASVTLLYPDTNVAATYGTLTGTLTHGGTAVKGANVWARETTTGKHYSVVSDYLEQGTGYFKLLLPAGTYTLGIEAIASDFNGGSSVGPYAETFPTSPSFQPPLYSGTTPMTGVMLGGNASPATFPITAGCAATLTLGLSGTGTVGGNCAPVVAPPPPPPPPTEPPPPPPGAKDDILWRNASTGQLYRLAMNGLAVTGGANVYREADVSWKVVGRADFNGDGVRDLLWRHDVTGRVSILFFDANGAAANATTIWTEPDPAWHIVATPDLDGNGSADILWWNGTTGKVYAMLVGGGMLLQHGLLYTEPNVAWSIVGSGDFAGTGGPEQVLWRNAATGDLYLQTVALAGTSFATAGQVIYREPNLAWDIAGIADLNGDGRSDIVYRNEATGQVFGLLMNGPAAIGGGMIHTEPNLAWRLVAFGDYDGNGKADLLWRNATTGLVYGMLMNGLSVASQGRVYDEPNNAWRILGPPEFAP